jgi:hypothetical protein
VTIAIATMMLVVLDAVVVAADADADAARSPLCCC